MAKSKMKPGELMGIGKTASGEYCCILKGHGRVAGRVCLHRFAKWNPSTALEIPTLIMRSDPRRGFTKVTAVLING